MATHKLAHPGRSSSTRSRSPKRCATGDLARRIGSRPASASRARSWCAVTRCTSSRRTWTRTPAGTTHGAWPGTSTKNSPPSTTSSSSTWSSACGSPASSCRRMQARLRVLWNQDLLTPAAGQGVMAIGWALDKIVYVSEYHRKQWEAIQPEIAPLGAVTKNGFDPFARPDGRREGPEPDHSHQPAGTWPRPVAADVARLQGAQSAGDAPDLPLPVDVRRRGHERPRHLPVVRRAGQGGERAGRRDRVSRLAEQGAALPGDRRGGGHVVPGRRELRGDVVHRGDRGAGLRHAVRRLAAGRAAGDRVSVLRSWATAHRRRLRGRLSERAIAQVEHLLEGCARQTFEYRKLQQAGRKFVETYTYAALAAEWEAMVDGWFAERYEANKLRVLRQLLHEDDHTTAMVVAHEIIAPQMHADVDAIAERHRSRLGAARRRVRLLQRVIQGKEQGAEDYASHAIQDPLDEVELSGRFKLVAPYFAGCTRVLDVACGNGAGAIALRARPPASPRRRHRLREGNIEHARAAAARGRRRRSLHVRHRARSGTSTRRAACTRSRRLRDSRRPSGRSTGCSSASSSSTSPIAARWSTSSRRSAEGATVIYTCPSGRSASSPARHVHPARPRALLQAGRRQPSGGRRRTVGADFMEIGLTPRGHAGRPLDHPLPDGGRSQGRGTRLRDPGQAHAAAAEALVGLIAKDAENDLGRCLASSGPSPTRSLSAIPDRRDTPRRSRRATARRSSTCRRWKTSAKASPARATPCSAPARVTGSSGSMPTSN
jgi:hypothetical protein